MTIFDGRASAISVTPCRSLGKPFFSSLLSRHFDMIWH